MDNQEFAEHIEKEAKKLNVHQIALEAACGFVMCESLNKRIENYKDSSKLKIKFSIIVSVMESVGITLEELIKNKNIFEDVRNELIKLL